MSSHTGEERRLPNEIFAVIIGQFYDDPASLRNIALVCKDFAVMSQFHIFQTVCLLNRDLHVSKIIKQFASLLRDTKQTSFLGKFVKELDLFTNGRFFMEYHDALMFIFRNLPSLSKLRMQALDIQRLSPIFIEVIKTGFGSRLVELRISGISFDDSEDLKHLQGMLSSLSGLKILAMYECHTSGSDLPTESSLILPGSLTVASFGIIDPEIIRAIALGMSLQSPDLHSLILDDSCESNAEIYTMIWRSLGPNTRVILNVGGGFFDIDDMIDCMKELRMSQIMLLCFGHKSTPTFFTRFISGLPPPVRRICIDFNAAKLYSLGEPNGWSELDAALMERHEMGLLECVSFTCTIRTDTFGFRLPSWSGIGPGRRLILDCVETSLPGSKGKGLIEVDRTMMYLQVSNEVCRVCAPSALHEL
ncbi:hypothetical protein GYMLUDRAFT_44471 [Collybiopsis luxurians FD-317 M1]|uniref:F-box domain-containing protein n=1 Tax=Collybiopsis luxurians FD-317 M1 TaxID=944289 RepID=A0A0D0BVH4_9AGAR|nr:hypothetical protein GYMLUDRAFT_44471 [Collybiopsis luxurians FD-317 M1]